MGRGAKSPVEIDHRKEPCKQNRHNMPGAIARIQSARDTGVDVTADMYPYAASGTGLDSVLPPWLAEGGTYFETLADPSVQERIRAEVLAPSGAWEALAHAIGPGGVMPVGFEQPENLPYASQRLPSVPALGLQY